MKDMFDEVISELEEIKKEQDVFFENDLIASTVAKLLDIEKRALYGNLKSKNKNQESIINQGFLKYKESTDVDS